MSEEFPPWYVAPVLDLDAFTCPNCGVNSPQTWGWATQNVGNMRSQTVHGVRFAMCVHCKEYSIWWGETMVHPKIFSAHMPSQDLPNDVRDVFLEARSIVYDSPRGASALLRLCMEKLCTHLEAKGDTYNAKIADLVRRGLPAQIQQSLDYARFVGNNAIHPGQIDLEDGLETAMALFNCVNLVAQRMIGDPARLDQMYQKLPESFRNQVEKRDAP